MAGMCRHLPTMTCGSRASETELRTFAYLHRKTPRRRRDIGLFQCKHASRGDSESSGCPAGSGGGCTQTATAPQNRLRP